jgi:hypothetical protein
MPKLYELTEQFKNLVELLDDPTIANDEVLNAAISIEGEWTEKVQGIAKLIKNLESDANGFEDEERRLREQKQYRRNRIESLKQYLSTAMQTAGVKKVDGIVPVAFRKCPASVEITDPFVIPAKYQKPQEPTFDKKAILDDLKSGKEIIGAVLVDDKEYLKIG